MELILRGYDVNAATWFYLSLLLIVAVFFRFGRLWSLRNLDLALLLLLSPGLLLVRDPDLADIGYGWLFTVTGCLLLRLFCDGLFRRRPRMDQNLNASGMTFLCLSAFAFLTAINFTKAPPQSTVETVRRGNQLLNRQDASSSQPLAEAGPTSTVVGALSNAVATANGSRRSPGGAELIAVRVMATLAHLAVVLGLFFIGRRHLGDTSTGLAMATLYLLLPCTSYDVHKVNHVLPAALIVWSIFAYDRPLVAGCLMGLACGTLFFPIFLLPLWVAFYGWRRGVRFGTALCATGAVLLASLALTSADVQSFSRQTFGWIDWSMLKFRGGQADGFWSVHNSAYSVPVVVGYALMLIFLTVRPRRKNLEHLMAHSAAIIVGTQFWYPQQGGVYVLWYLPLVLIVVFRPQLKRTWPETEPSSAHQQRNGSTAPPRELVGSAAGNRPLFR